MKYFLFSSYQPHRCIRVKFVLFLTLAFSIIICAPTKALSDYYYDLFYQNGIYYYDPDGITYNGCIPSATTKPNGDQITWVGDSYSAGAAATAKISAMLPGVDIHAQDSKRFDIGTATNPSGISILGDLEASGSLREYIIFALGTNNQSGISQAAIDQIKALADAGKKIVLVTPYTAIENYATTRSQIEALKGYNNNSIVVADWAAAAQGHEGEYFSNDGIHPNATGLDVWLKAIQSVIPGVTSAVQAISGTDNKALVMAGLISRGYSQEAAAAIIGNLMGESGADPKLLEGGATVPDNFVAFRDGSKTFSGGFGIAQWTSAGRVKNLQDYADSVGQPVTSLQVQIDFLVKELEGWAGGRFTPAAMNSNSFEENVFNIYRYFETPSSSYRTRASGYTDYQGDSNDYDPRSLSDLDPQRTKAAYKEYSKRLGYAKNAMGISAGTVAGICPNGYSPGGLISGGLTYDEAMALMYDYISDRVQCSQYSDNCSNPVDHGKANCPTFVDIFINRFTTMGRVSMPGGKKVVARLTGEGYGSVAPDPNNYASRGFVFTGTEPRVYSVFSRLSGGCINGTCWGHTGVVVGINTTENVAYIVQAGSYADTQSTYMKASKMKISLDTLRGGDYYFAYIPEQYLKIDELRQAIADGWADMGA